MKSVKVSALIVANLVTSALNAQRKGVHWAEIVVDHVLESAPRLEVDLGLRIQERLLEGSRTNAFHPRLIKIVTHGT